MDSFLHSDDDNSVPEEERSYIISKRGVEEILSWIRFQSQLCEMIHQNEDCEEKEHEVALLMAFALTPWIEFYRIDEEKDKE